MRDWACGIEVSSGQGTHMKGIVVEYQDTLLVNIRGQYTQSKINANYHLLVP